MIIHSAVWGRDYIKVFLNYCLPSLEISDEIDIKLIVHTRKSDIKHFDSLKKNLSNFELKIIPETLFVSKTAVEIHTEIWEQTRSFYSKEMIMNLAPDTIWSSGTLKKIIHEIQINKTSIGYIHYLRVNQEEILKNFESKSLIGLQSSDLYKIARNYKHQLHLCNNIEASESSKWPEYIYENVEGGVISKIFLKEPLFYEGYLSRDLISSDILRRKIVFYGSTSDIFCLSLTPESADKDWYKNRPAFSDDYVSTWLSNFNETLVRGFEGYYVTWFDSDEVVKSSECGNLKKLADRIILKSSLYKLINNLSENGYFSQANFLMKNLEQYIELAKLRKSGKLAIIDTGEQSGHRSHSSIFWPSFERDFVTTALNRESQEYSENKDFLYSSENYLMRGKHKYLKIQSTEYYEFYAKQ